MGNLYLFIGKRLPEIGALILSTVFFTAGTYLAFNSNPAWLNRAGALIIITGVLLATSRFHEWIAQTVIDCMNNSPDRYSTIALDIHERNTGTTLSEEERIKFTSEIKSQLAKYSVSEEWSVKHLNSVVQPAKQRLKLMEIYLVVTGTFLNGFGDYLVTLLKQ